MRLSTLTSALLSRDPAGIGHRERLERSPEKRWVGQPKPLVSVKGHPPYPRPHASNVLRTTEREGVMNSIPVLTGRHAVVFDAAGTIGAAVAR